MMRRKRAENPDAEPGRKKPARHKIMDILARRDHSEAEIKKKLSEQYSPEEIAGAITQARESGWLAEPEVLSERAARALGRKRKSHRYINQFLKAKGLPPVGRDVEGEVAKGVTLVRARLRRELPFDREGLLKARRLLTNRGFDGETIRRVLDSLASRD